MSRMAPALLRLPLLAYECRSCLYGRMQITAFFVHMGSGGRESHLYLVLLVVLDQGKYRLRVKAKLLKIGINYRASGLRHVGFPGASEK